MCSCHRDSCPKYSFNRSSELSSRLMNLGLEQRRCDVESTCFHHSRLPKTAFGFFLFSLMISEILLLIELKRSLLLREILDLALSIDFTRGDIQTGSRDDIRTDFSGRHLSISVRIFFSRRSTAKFILSAVKTSPQSSAASAKKRASLRCFLQSRNKTLRRVGFSFVPTGKTKPSWSVFISRWKG